MHEGHRGRLVGKVKSGSLLYEHELLEILLFNACRRKDVNAAAHELIDRCGGLSGVLRASREELMQVKGVGENVADYLVCLGKCTRRFHDCLSFAVVRSTEQFGKFLSLRFGEGSVGATELYFLDKDGRIRNICTFREKEGVRPEVSAGEAVRLISVYKPYGVFAASFGTSGDALPDAADDQQVEAIGLACGLSGTRFYDYCVVRVGVPIYSYFVSGRLAPDRENESRGVAPWLR